MSNSGDKDQRRGMLAVKEPFGSIRSENTCTIQKEDYCMDVKKSWIEFQLYKINGLSKQTQGMTATTSEERLQNEEN